MKQVIIIRKDLGMRCGKMVSQGAHASLKSLIDLGSYQDNKLIIPLNEDIKTWLTTDFKKITCRVESEQELLELYKKVTTYSDIPCSLIKDLGLTELKEPTYTSLAIGPAEDEVIDQFTWELKLL